MALSGDQAESSPPIDQKGNHLTNAISIGFVQPSGDTQVQFLETRVQTYRPEDQAEVEAMYVRARLAEQMNRVRNWKTIFI